MPQAMRMNRRIQIECSRHEAAFAGRFRRAATIALLLLGVCSGFAIGPAAECVCGAEPTLGARNRAADFQWLDSLGLPDLTKTKFVRVATGAWSKYGDAPARNFYFHGFLLGTDGDDFTVFGGDLRTRTFEKSAAGGEEYQRVGYESADPLKFVDGIDMRTFGDPYQMEGGDRRHRYQISGAAELAVLAWGCSKLGHDKAAAALYDLALKAPNQDDSGDSATPFRKRLACDLAHAEMWTAVLKFGNPTESRERLRARFEHIVEHYPESKHVERAKEHAAQLATMVREDREHAERRQAGKPVAELTGDERIAELIFQLREQNGRQYAQPGACDIFHTGDDKQDSPAHQLVAIGYDAVPQLIEAIEDRRFSRSIGYVRSHFFSHHVLRIGDCAHLILAVIAGRGFYGERDKSGKLVYEGGESTPKKMIAAWYAELRKKGEKGLLVDAVAVGDRRSYELAEKLVEKYPQDALAPLIAGARRAEEGFVRVHLVVQAGNIPGEAPIPFLLEELKSGANFLNGIAAAYALQARGRPEGLAAVVAEWKKTVDAKPDPEVDQSLAKLAQFLASSGSVKGLDALAEKFASCPTDVRLEAIEAVVDRDSEHWWLPKRKGPLAEPVDVLGAKAPKELRMAALKLFLAALHDTERRIGLSGSRGDKSYTDPRICDMAANLLNELDAERYPFDLEATLQQRDAELAALKNGIRKDLSLPETPKPAKR